MKKVLRFLKKFAIETFDFLFKKSPVLKMIISFFIALVIFFIADQTEIVFLWYAGLPFLIHTLIIFLIGMVYAWIINPIKDWKETKALKEQAKKNTTES